MAIYMDCIACQSGQHENHRDVPVPGPEGGVGGQVCTCRGECAARADQTPCSTFDCNRPAVVNGRCENCERIVAKYRSLTARDSDQTGETVVNGVPGFYVVNPGTNIKKRCWLQDIPGAGRCDGRLVRCHLIRRQVICREVGARYERDPRTWVWGCGGITGIGGHHGMLDWAGVNRLHIPRDMLPAELEEFAAEVGLGWWLTREYGMRPEPLDHAA